MNFFKNIIMENTVLWEKPSLQLIEINDTQGGGGTGEENSFNQGS